MNTGRIMTYYLRSRVNVVYLSIVIILFFSGCEEERIHVNVDNYIEFLSITPEQETDVKPMLIDARDIIEDYNAKLEAGSKRSKQKKDLLDLKISLLERLHPLMRTILQQLDSKQQRQLWRRSELYYFYTTTRRYAVNNYTFSFKLTHKKSVTPVLSPQSEKGGSPTDPLESWTVYFGMPVYSFFRGNIRKSIDPAARNRFPISIQATLVDKSLRTKEEELSEPLPVSIDPESVIEIRVLLSTRLHTNFIDINNWITFLTLPNDTEVEPVKIVARNEKWFEDRGLLVSKRFPKFLLTLDQQREDVDRAQSEARRYSLENLHTYYQLFFPAEINNAPIISPDVASIKLVFLEDIGSINRAEGTWNFDWTNK